MKKTVSALLVLCLIIALLPVMAVSAQAASGSIENCLQFAAYYDENTGKLSDDGYPCVLVKNGGNNLIITAAAPQSGWKIAFLNPAIDQWCSTEYVGDWNGILHIYITDPSYGAEAGFLPLGMVTQNEKIRYVGFDKDWEPIVIDSVALDYKDGTIIPQDPISTKYTVAVVNSKNQICAVEYGGVCVVLGETTKESFYGNSGGQGSEEDPEPPATEPPATEPPTTEPPATEPPATEPPATEPRNTDVEQIESDVVALKDLDKIYEDAVVQKKPSKTGAIVLVCAAVLIAVLLGAVIIVKRRNKMKINEELNEAEEGTVLADIPADTGLRLQFRNGKRVAVKRGFTIGRAPGNDVVVPPASTAVSGRHCEIIVQNGAVYLRDLGSTNGTFINGRRLVSGQLVQLLPGMTVSLGSPSGPESFSVVLSSSR